MNLWSEIESGSDIPDVVTAVIEVPKGSRNKYEYDKEREAFMLDRVLYSPVVYPADYGFIPKSTYDDGDPMDILVLMEQPTFPGCLIEARPIGIMGMIDGGDKDYKILAVPEDDPRFSDVQDISDVPSHLLKEIEHFFSVYKNLEGKVVETKGWDDGGPFTTDKCGNVFDRWNNKIYEANGCNVGGYNLVRTSVVD